MASLARRTFPVICAVILPTASLHAAGNPNFNGGFFPWEAALGRDGNLYGGTTMSARGNGGSVYRITPDDKVRAIAYFRFISFSPVALPTGTTPRGALAAAPDGSFYGSTSDAGVFGKGTIFRVEPSGRTTTLYHYEEAGNPGYGLAWADDCVYSLVYQAVVRLAKDGTVKVIDLPADSGSVRQVIATSTGSIVVATYRNDIFHPGPPANEGKLWRLRGTLDGFDLLANVGFDPHSLCALDDGGIIGLDANTAFKVTSNGTVTVMHQFGDPAEGTTPRSLFKSWDGNYYGSTYYGGTNGNGVVFQITPFFSYTVLSSYPNIPSDQLGYSWVDKLGPFRFPPVGGNREPFAKDDLLAASTLKVPAKSPAGTLPRATLNVLKNDGDADKDKLTISEVGTPAHGTATVDPNTQTITYTADSTTPVEDAFTYTVSDARGGSARARVSVRTNPAGKFDSGMSFNGKLTVSVSVARGVSGKLVVDGKTYSFIGKLNEVNRYAKTLVYSAHTGALSALQLNLRQEAGEWVVDAFGSGKTFRFQTTCTRVQ